MTRDEMLKQFKGENLWQQVEEIFSRLTVDQICELTDAAIDNFPDSMPKKRLRMRGRVKLVKGVIYGKLTRFEKVV